jgi:C4-dicarboxylate-specific signal transduction histidine kinase
MKLSTRLLLPLLAAVTAVMSAFTIWAVRQREATLIAEARREAHAYAVALGLAMESAFRQPFRRDVQEIIDRLSRESTVYGVIVYDADGSVLFLSDPLRPEDAARRQDLEAVLRAGQESSLERDIKNEAVYAVIRPIRDPLGEVLGAYEVAQPLSFLRAEISRTRLSFVLITLILLLAVTIMILWLVRSMIARPLAGLVAGAQALARGDLSHRVGGTAASDELSELAREFDRMARSLEGAQTQLVRQTEERILLERRLRESEKLAAVGNISAGLAHEVGAPLHVIRGRAEMMLRRTDLPAPDRRNLRIIVEQIERITRIVQSLLDFTRRPETRVGPVDARAIVAGVAEFLDGEFERMGAALQWEGPEMAWVRADPQLLHQVFINLFVNALQALERAEPPRVVLVRAHQAERDNQVIIEVEDNGPGIPDDRLENVFHPFYTTKPSGEGTGLGLAVVKSIISEHGGSITAARGAHGGALFRITLPAAVPEPAHA